MIDLTPIANADILRGLDDEELIELGEIASEREFRRRECLFRRGEKAEMLFIATRGKFALTVDLRVFDDSVEMAVEEKGPHEAFGWSSLVEPRTSIYSGYCLEDGAVVAFPRRELEALMTTNWRLGEELLHNLNELIGTRVRVLQKMWLEEVAQSTTRVQYWTHTELTNQWAGVMTAPNVGAARHWMRRHLHTGPGN